MHLIFTIKFTKMLITNWWMLFDYFIYWHPLHPLLNTYLSPSHLVMCQQLNWGQLHCNWNTHSNSGIVTVIGVLFLKVIVIGENIIGISNYFFNYIM